MINKLEVCQKCHILFDIFVDICVRSYKGRSRNSCIVSSAVFLSDVTNVDQGVVI